MKVFKYLSFVLFLSIGFTACKQKTIITTSSSYSERHSLTEDSTKGALNLNLSVELPACYGNDTILKTIRQTLIENLFGGIFVEYGNDSILKVFAERLKNDYEEAYEPFLSDTNIISYQSFFNEHNLEGFSLLTDEHIYSYGINRYVFMGGAHGLEMLTYLNFDLNTGRLINEADLFEADYKNALTDLLKVRLVEQSNEDPSAETILSLGESDYWVESISPNNNFYISDEGINYVFNPYEIGPYYLGCTEVSIPFARIKDLLKKPSIIDYLIYNNQN